MGIHKSMPRILSFLMLLISGKKVVEMHPTDYQRSKIHPEYYSVNDDRRALLGWVLLGFYLTSQATKKLPDGCILM